MVQALTPSPHLPPVTPDAFFAEKRRFWNSFNSFTIGGIVAVICVVLLVFYCIL